MDAASLTDSGMAFQMTGELVVLQAAFCQLDFYTNRAYMENVSSGLGNITQAKRINNIPSTWGS